jgi:hypothetical protein
MGVILKAATMLQAGSKSSKRVLQSDVDKELPTPMFQASDVKEAA